MNLFLYVMMVGTGGFGCAYEMLFGKTNRWLLFSTGFLFVLTACSRIGNAFDYSDLVQYILYFMEDNDAYFEPGYVFLTDVIKWTVGYHPVALVAFISLWVFMLALLSETICSRYMGIDEEMECSYYPSTFFLLIIVYWGCCFSCEVLRNGLAIPLIFCAAAFLINEKYWMALLITAFAVLFHYSSVIFIPGIIIMAAIRELKKDWFLYWFFTLIVLDIVISFFFSFAIPIVSGLFDMMEELEELSHFNAYKNAEVEGYFTTQYITYHAFGLLMLLGNLEDKRYNSAVMLYFIGLSLGTLFQTTIIVMRIQWMFLPMVVFVLYYYLRDNQQEEVKKQIVLVSYCFIQSIMALRYLGWHV